MEPDQNQAKTAVQAAAMAVATLALIVVVALLALRPYQGKYAQRPLQAFTLALLGPGGGNLPYADDGLVRFDLAGPVQAAYPALWAVPLALAGVSAYLLVLLAYALRKRRILPRDVLKTLLAGLLLSIQPLGLGALWFGVAQIVPAAGAQNAAPPGDAAWWFVGVFLVLVTGSVMILFWTLAQRWGWRVLAFGGLLPWLPLALLAAYLAPAVSYLFTWVPLVATLPLIVGVRGDGRVETWSRWSVMAFAAVPVVSLGAQSIYLVFAAAGGASLPLVIGLAYLLAGALAPQLALLVPPGRKPYPALALFAAGLVTVVILMRWFS